MEDAMLFHVVCFAFALIVFVFHFVNYFIICLFYGFQIIIISY